MLRFFKKILAYSVYRKTLVTYAASVVVTTIVLLLSIFGVVAYYIQEISVNNSELVLNQLISHSEAVQNDVEHIFSLTSNDPNALTFMSAQQEDKLVNYRLYQSLADLKATYTYIRDISIINLKTAVCVQSLGKNVEGSQNYQFFLESSAAGQNAVLREIHYYLEHQTYKVVSFWKYIPHTESVLLVDVDASRFNYTISSPETDRSVFVIDSQGKGISQNTSHVFGSKNYEAYLSDILQTHNSGANEFVYNDYKNQAMIFFAKSPGLDWWYIDIQSYTSFFKSYWDIAVVFLVISVSFLVLCLIIFLIFSKRIRRPLIALVEKYQTEGAIPTAERGQDIIQTIDNAIHKIDHERHLNDKYIEAQFLKTSILGEEMPFFVSKEKLRDMHQSYHAEAYTVLLLCIESQTDVPEEKQKEEYSMLRFMVCNLADEIFGEHYRCRSVDIGGQQVVLLLLTNSGRLGEEYVLCFSRLQKFCRKELKLAVYGAVGNTVDNQNDLYLSYHTALRYMDMGRLVGKKDLLGPENTLRSSYQKKNQQLADAMEEYTALHYADPELSLKSIAQVFHFSPTYLGKIYKSVKAKSYASYLINFRLEYSKTLLSETNQSINEVATAVGFINSSYYATVFKSTYGMTPSSYRNHMKHL